jgi:hypothetical protein
MMVSMASASALVILSTAPDPEVRAIAERRVQGGGAGAGRSLLELLCDWCAAASRRALQPASHGLAARARGRCAGPRSRVGVRGEPGYPRSSGGGAARGKRPARARARPGAHGSSKYKNAARRWDVSRRRHSRAAAANLERGGRTGAGHGARRALRALDAGIRYVISPCAPREQRAAGLLPVSPMALSVSEREMITVGNSLERST